MAEYLIDLNAAQAARRAGYSAKTAESAGPRMLRFVQVAEAIAAAKAKRLARTEITQDRVLEELSLLAFSDLTHFEVDPQGNVTLSPEAPAGAMRALQSIKREISSIGGDDEDAITTARVEVKLWDKPGMLKLAGRHVGLFPDRIEVSGPNGGPIRTAASLTTGERRARLKELRDMAQARLRGKKPDGGSPAE